jgi:hypothetical protein
MTYYIAPTTIETTDKPTIDIPQYYLVSSSAEKLGKRISYFGCNFPAFMKRNIVPLYDPPVFKAFVDQYGRVNVTLQIEDPDMKITDTQIIIPLTLHFNYYEKPTVYTYISLRMTASDPDVNVYKYNSNIKFEQIGNLVTTTNTLKEFLDPIDPLNYIDIFSIDHVINHFNDTPLKTRFISSRIVRNKDNTTTGTSFSLQFSTPSMIVEMPAPYCNILRNTYIQLFYWAWILLAIFRPFISSAYEYGIIPTTRVKLLEPNKKVKFD